MTDLATDPVLDWVDPSKVARTTAQKIEMRDKQKIMMHGYIGYLKGYTDYCSKVPADVKEIIDKLHEMTMAEIFDFTPEDFEAKYSVQNCFINPQKEKA